MQTFVASRCAAPGADIVSAIDRDKELQMAERIVRQLVDDIDGSDIADGAGERIEFSVRCVRSVIDLSSANSAQFDKA